MVILELEGGPAEKVEEHIEDAVSKGARFDRR
jgi:hypothetical protein